MLFSFTSLQTFSSSNTTLLYFSISLYSFHFYPNTSLSPTAFHTLFLYFVLFYLLTSSSPMYFMIASSCLYRPHMSGYCSNTFPLPNPSSSVYVIFFFSSPFFCSKYVLHLKDDITDGIGLPDWRLVLCLLFSWLLIFLTQAQGIKSAGKVRLGFFLYLFVLFYIEAA